MKALLQSSVVALALFSSSLVSAQAVVGQPAPVFTSVNTLGQAVSLSQFKGKYVVMEWFNPDCPYTQGHYESGNMPAVQKYATDKGVVWLSVNTTDEPAKTAQVATALTAWMKSKKSSSTATLVDADGKIGRAYGARTTPHMFMIDPQGKLIYAGAIDSKVPSSPADIASATNYVRQGLDEILSGKMISQAVTKPYGCSVKYSKAG
ncbi:redoxin domain-containing protein [Rugamonas sp. A1-17]|nr:redoxin domain-containing protein [Rugamonas sp. A1-17]